MSTKTAPPPELVTLAAELPTFISFTKAAELTTLSRRSLEREVEGGRLACYRIGRARAFRLRTADVLALVERVA